MWSQISALWRPDVQQQMRSFKEKSRKQTKMVFLFFSA